MALISDNTLDAEITKMRALCEGLRVKQTVFSNTFRNLHPKERAKLVKEIQADHKILQTFITKAKATQTTNSGTKFAVETLKQSFQTTMTVWRKIEKSLEDFTSGNTFSGTKPRIDMPPPTPASGDLVSSAVDLYKQTLQNLGHNISDEHLGEFKDKFIKSYEKAKEKAGDKELSVKIVEESGKIKIRVEPK